MNLKSLIGAFLTAVGTGARKGIPSSTSFPKELLFSHPALRLESRASTSTIAGLYARTLFDQVESLKICSKEDKGFSLDGLAHAFNKSAEIFEKIPELLGPAPAAGARLSYDEFEFVFKKVSKPGTPSITAELMTSQKLFETAQEFKSNFNMIYVDRIFDNFTFEAIQREVNRLWTSSDLEPNCNLDGENRMGGYIHLTPEVAPDKQHESLYNLIYANEPLRLWISAVTGENVFASDFPIELREYGNQSRGMACHSDVQMYANVSLNYEIVVTVSNHGKSDLTWLDRSNIKRTIRSQANSITIVQPNAAVHCVGDSGGGFREILKFIFVGTFHKHPNFFQYVRNKCSAVNPNVKKVRARRIELRDTQVRNAARKPQSKEATEKEEL